MFQAQIKARRGMCQVYFDGDVVVMSQEDRGKLSIEGKLAILDDWLLVVPYDGFYGCAEYELQDIRSTVTAERMVAAEIKRREQERQEFEERQKQVKARYKAGPKHSEHEPAWYRNIRLHKEDSPVQ